MNTCPWSQKGLCVIGAAGCVTLKLCDSLVCAERGTGGWRAPWPAERAATSPAIMWLRPTPSRQKSKLPPLFFPLFLSSQTYLSFITRMDKWIVKCRFIVFCVLWVGWETQSISDMRCDGLLIVKSVVKQLTLTLDPDFCTWESQQSSLFMLLSTLFKWTRVDVH